MGKIDSNKDLSRKARSLAKQIVKISKTENPDLEAVQKLTSEGYKIAEELSSKSMEILKTLGENPPQLRKF